MARVDLETPRDSPAEPGLGSKYCNILICSRQRARAATSLGSSARAPTMCLAARRPARQPCFYTGWRVVLACFLVQMASAPGHTFGVNAFVDSWVADLSLTRMEVSTVWLLASVCSGLGVPFAGIALDRYGARWLITLVGP